MGFALKIARRAARPKSTRASARPRRCSISRSTSTAGRASSPAASASASRWAARSSASRASSSWTSRSRTSTRSCASRRAAEIAALQRRLGVTTVYVTHDQVEAMTMGDRVAVMKDGVLQQCDTPRALYDSPVNAFVAGFIGSPAMNLIEGTIEAGGRDVGSTSCRCRARCETVRRADGGRAASRWASAGVSRPRVARRGLPRRSEPRRGTGLGGLRYASCGAAKV